MDIFDNVNTLSPLLALKGPNPALATAAQASVQNYQKTLYCNHPLCSHSPNFHILTL